MNANLTRQITALRLLDTSELRDRYVQLFGESTRSGNRDWLLKKVAWRLQAKAEGDLSDRAKRRAAELADDADLRVVPPRSEIEVDCSRDRRNERDQRLPPVGSVLVREYKGQAYRVTVLADGFEFEGEQFQTLTAVAKQLTGQHLNGFAFFGLNRGDE